MTGGTPTWWLPLSPPTKVFRSRPSSSKALAQGLPWLALVQVSSSLFESNKSYDHLIVMNKALQYILEDSR